MGEGDQDGWPPGLDGLGEPGGLGHGRVDRGVVEVGQPPADVGRLSLFQQHAEAFLDTPSGADLAGRIVIIEHSAKPGPLLGAEVVGAGEQQPPVQPDWVGDGAATAQLLAGDPLPDLGQHLVGQRDQVPTVDRDQRVREGSADAGGIRRRRVNHHDLDLFAERVGLLAEPVLHTCPGAPRSQAQ